MENKEIKTYKVILIDGSIIGIDANWLDWDDNSKTLSFYNLPHEDMSDPFSWVGQAIAIFNINNIIGFTEWEEE